MDIKNQKKRIMIDLIAMRYLYTGTYFYCNYVVSEMATMLGAYPDWAVTLFLPKRAQGLFDAPFTIRKIKKCFKLFIPFKRQYDLWHAPFQITKYFPYSYRGKILLTVHDLNFLHEDLPAEKKKAFLIETQKRLDKAIKVVAISQFVKNDILQNCRIKADKIDVIYNGATYLENIVPTAPANFPKGRFFFTIGMVEDKKNFKVLSAMLLDNSHHLIIAGRISDAAYSKEIMTEAQRLGVENRVYILGPITDSEKVWCYQNCDMFAFPSKAEGFGMPVLEAMSFGKPVILSKCTSLPELGGEVAYYFDNFETEEVRQKTNEALADFSANSEVKIAALQKHAAQFTWASTAENYLKLYKKILND